MGNSKSKFKLMILLLAATAFTQGCFRHGGGLITGLGLGLATAAVIDHGRHYGYDPYYYYDYGPYPGWSRYHHHHPHLYPYYDAENQAESWSETQARQTEEVVYARMMGDGDYAGALWDLDRRIEKSPDSAELLRARGLCHFELKQWEQSLKDYEKALALKPGDEDLQYMVNALLQSLGRPKKKF
jgi:tetratricopeptide (TPR) repeat protein